MLKNTEFRSFLGSKAKDQKQKVLNATPAASESNEAAAAAAPASGQMVIQVKNRFNSSNVYAYITGQALDNGNKVCLIRSDGKTPYYPDTPPKVGTALAEDVGIRLGGSGSITSITIPHLAGGRLWFSVDQQLTFLLNPGGAGAALVEPSISNPSDPNIDINWGFCEFTFSNGVIYANISYVDFVSIPIAMTLVLADGNEQKVAGLKPDGLEFVCNGLESQGGDWPKLVYKADGKRLRALSPNNGIVMNGGNLFQGYYDSYVNQVWDKYSNSDLTVDTQAQWGILKGRVKNDVLEFPGASFAKPTTGDIFSNSTGPFQDNSNAKGPLTARLCAAFNRSTLLVNDVQPTKEQLSTFYKEEATNHFSRLVHEANIDGRGYAFPYDDVPAGDVDQSGFVNGAPQDFIVSVG